MASNTDMNLFGGLTGTEDIYKMSSKLRGYCCLFLNQHFYDNEYSKTISDIRQGADVDIRRLGNVFENLKFEPKELFDLSKTELLNKLNEVLHKRLELESHDAFIAIFSSHGHSSLIFDKYWNPIFIDEIMEKFKSDNCPALANKPKIIIFLCCRGAERMDAINLKTILSSGLDFEEGEDDEDIVAIYGDTIICYSTVQKFFSLRSTNEGTLYGNFLADNLIKYSKDKDFEYILKKTEQNMRDEDIVYDGERQKMMSSVKTIGWTKYLYFNPDYQ